jgi:hypothetical protein
LEAILTGKTLVLCFVFPLALAVAGCSPSNTNKTSQPVSSKP